MEIPDPKFNFNSPDYRYGYNGKEKDNEVKGVGNHIDYGMRVYDPRVCRFFTTDPLFGEYPELTPYQFASNTPIWGDDLDGLEVAYKNKAGIWVTPGDHFRIPPPTLPPATDEALKAGVARMDRQMAIFAEVVMTIAPVGRLAKVAYRLWKLRSPVQPPDAPKPRLNNTPQQTGKKRPPNPNGKKGGTDHQEKVNEAEKKLQEEGYETQREVKVETPDGEKTKRYIDVQGTKPTGEVKSVQVGKQNKDGTPVSRETKAMDDIEQATGQRPDFVPYNTDPKTPPPPPAAPN
jgi:RHS repeat-associated protein